MYIYMNCYYHRNLFLLCTPIIATLCGVIIICMFVSINAHPSEETLFLLEHFETRLL